MYFEVDLHVLYRQDCLLAACIYTIFKLFKIYGTTHKDAVLPMQILQFST